ncbi:MAG: phosphoribosylformylglycinamidine synthase subunit PurQ [Thermoplasmata archaeon HGW-Thermoplasmata-1]|nr:MAG: phosphoribosylformylglycinamidine synthase subunit PurQ [Thermoplasmata archaeon HGW-Thermoplasmata-1]
MKVSDAKVCILQIEGTNCDEETYWAFKRLGADPEVVHLKQLIGTGIPHGMKRSLSDYQCLIFPGGFSAGDYVRAGAIFAARMKATLAKELRTFIGAGYPVGGICNGFQIMVELGVLPGLGESMTPLPEAILDKNDSDRYECRPTLLKHESRGNCVFTSKLPQNKVVMIPCAHAEGKLAFPKKEGDRIVEKLIENDQIVFRYVDEDGNYAGYPWCPNGAIYNIAGICNPAGNVFGLMPHPERAFHRFQHPDWTRTGLGESGEGENGDGKVIFESALDYIGKKF